jgi:hypothetical protein
MAKVTITLEDRRDGSDNMTVSLDVGGVPVNAFGHPHQSLAVRTSQTLFAFASMDERMAALSAHRKQPSNLTIH